MPAVEEFDSVHPLTVAGERYGCHNRKPFKDFYMAPDGIRTNGTINLRPVTDTSSRDCSHDQKASDPRCAGCKWIESAV